jgi:L-aspartate oxidase
MITETDVLIIGAGIAGCCTALAVADAGYNVLLTTRSGDPFDCSTAHAQGGIIYRGKDDSPDLLTRDILEAGAGICSEVAAHQLAEKGPPLVESLLIHKLGVAFDRDETGRFDITEEGAHSMPRILHVEDLTGRAIEEHLLVAVRKHPRINLLTQTTAVDLLTFSHHSKRRTDVYSPPTCMGAYLLDQQTQQVNACLARETVLATGGLGQIFLHTSNPPAARGDGIAMAYRAGARLINLEYVQFHPTTLYSGDASNFLISESVRGEGGVLVDAERRPFMEKYHPRGSLAPRDIVARAIHEEMLAQHTSCVYLDITHKPADWIRERFPNIHRRCLEAGIDMTKSPIPVVPAAHYSCGGVATDLRGRTSLDRLWAVGEVACTGLHGANRLASTSLLEGLVWGHEAGLAIAERLGEKQNYSPLVDEWKHEKEPVDPALIYQDWLTIRYTMWNYVGLARSRRRLNRARHILRELQMEVEDFYLRAVLTDDMVGLRNGVQTALAVLFAASENRQSIGCHYRID